MKRLENILKHIDVLDIKGSTGIDVTDITFDSRKVIPGAVFVAVKGTQTDGHLYVNQAVEAGARVIVYDDPHYKAEAQVTSIQVKNSAIILGYLASLFYDNPSSKLHLIGITGTNGKTTTATLLHRLFSNLGYKSGSFTTICNYVGEEVMEATHTTPDPVQLNRIMSKMVEAGCRFAFMEVSSHALVQHRIAGLTFRGGIFTNVTHDHLDYHKTFNEYIYAKKSFFDNLSENSFALINADDRNATIMVQNTKADVSFYGIRSLAKFKARIIESHMDGMLLDIDQMQLWTKIIGQFNAYNLLAVYGCGRLLGLNQEVILKGLSLLEIVKGRFQHLRSGNDITAIIDYAHTPDALHNVLKTIHAILKSEAKIITVVGAGGDRDKSKRPKMGHIAEQLSDIIILTSDNPRNEDPEEIIKDIKSGCVHQDVKKVVTITDRKEAIKTACLMARPDDIVLIAGKGHEDYQEIKGKKYHFSDAEIVQELFMINKAKQE